MAQVAPGSAWLQVLRVMDARSSRTALNVWRGFHRGGESELVSVGG